MTYYLKYRPQKIKELDLLQVRQNLSRILGLKELPHAFLFAGPKGTGKTSSARILAKSVNCLKRSKGRVEPCNRCSSCQLLNSGRSMDLIEIDAASNRGIDDIRDLREKIRLAPSQAKFKVYIIDEVHMLTSEAFNALLKTLEEPPRHAKLVLCTTQPEKLPGTIISRCQQISFAKAGAKEIERSLTRVVKAEKLKIKAADLTKISAAADGSFRDAVKILEQLSAEGKTISSKSVADLLESGYQAGQLDEWLIWLYQGKAEAALAWLDRAVNNGLAVNQFMLQIIGRLRQVLLLRLGVEHRGEELSETLTAIDNPAKLKELLWRLIEAAKEIKGAVIESLPLELLIVDWAKQSANFKTKTPSKQEQKNYKKAVNPGMIEEKWDQVLKAVKPHNHSLEALLRATKPVGFDGKYLNLEVFYKFHKERLEVERYRQIVEEVVSQIFSQPVAIRYYLGKKKPDIIETAVEVFGGEVVDDV